MFATLAIRDNYNGGGANFDALMIMLQCVGVIMGLFMRASEMRDESFSRSKSYQIAKMK